MTDDIVTKVNDTLTFYSAGLDDAVTVSVEQPDTLGQLFRELADAFRPAIEVFVAAGEELMEMFAQLAPFLHDPARRRRAYRRWNDPDRAADRMDWYRQQVEVGRWVSRTVRSRTGRKSCRT